jgi:hypothetical protein
MSMTQPMEPELPSHREGVPAADTGRGAPPPAEGFGVGGEEPDRPEQAADAVDAPLAAETPFRTPDPADVGTTGTPT